MLQQGPLLELMRRPDLQKSPGGCCPGFRQWQTPTSESPLRSLAPLYWPSSLVGWYSGEAGCVCPSPMVVWVLLCRL